jgi:hypothetical protein
MHKIIKILGYLSFPISAVVIAIYFQRLEFFYEFEEFKAGVFREKSNKVCRFTLIFSINISQKPSFICLDSRTVFQSRSDWKL